MMYTGFLGESIVQNRQKDKEGTKKGPLGKGGKLRYSGVLIATVFIVSFFFDLLVYKERDFSRKMCIFDIGE